MEPANKSFVKKLQAVFSAGKQPEAVAVAFLPDADEIEYSALPRMAQTTLYVLLLALVCFVIWASLSQIDKVVVAAGKLVTPLPNIVVQPLETAIIQSLDVRVGQLVKKGEQLATLDSTFSAADQTQLKLRLDTLNTQLIRLKAELAGDNKGALGLENADTAMQKQLDVERKASHQAQLAQLSEKLARLRVMIAASQEDQKRLTEQMKPIQEIESMQNKLVNKQYGSKLQLLESQEKRLDIERQLQLAKSHEQELRKELSTVEAERAAFDKKWRQDIMQELLVSQRERDEVNEQLLKAEKRHQLVTLISPENAVVLEIAKLSLGSVVQSAEPLFNLVPLDAALEAEVQIQSLDVGYVKRGDNVRLKMDAFPFQKHGVLEGVVRTISEDAFQRNAGSDSGSYYMSRIAFEASGLKHMPELARLLPGMTVSAEIVVGQRSVMSYLLWPLTKALTESITEP